MFGTDDKQINWNAGNEFNQLVGYTKQLYFIKTAERNIIELLDILSMDLDLTYQKILIEAKKDKKVREEEVRKDLDDIKSKILELQSNLSIVIGNENELNNLNIDIVKLRGRIWNLQGYFGVMYPVDKTEKKKWDQEIRDDYE